MLQDPVRKATFAEMEAVSPMVKLLPGEEYTYSENWYFLENTQADLTTLKTGILEIISRN